MKLWHIIHASFLLHSNDGLNFIWNGKVYVLPCLTVLFLNYTCLELGFFLNWSPTYDWSYINLSSVTRQLLDIINFVFSWGSLELLKAWVFLVSCLSNLILKSWRDLHNVIIIRVSFILCSWYFPVKTLCFPIKL